MYLVQTVTSRPRGWSSYTNVNTKDEPKLKSMNSVEEISIYKQDFIEPYSRNSVKTAATTYDFLEHPPKKDKKWSFGNIFRRKKKDDSESSSEDEVQKKNFLNKKKRKNDKRKKPTKPSLAFDHIVIPQNRGSYILSNGYNGQEDAGILSDPSGGFSSYIGRPLPRIPISSEENKIKQDSLSRNENHYSHNSLGSMDSLKKGRRERTKARAIARRDSLRPGSSSDEDSQRSYSSSRFKSDESLTRQRDGSLCRRSRTARTERYIRRLSKEDESILNREALQRQTRENWHLKLPDDRSSYGRSPSRSPILSSTPKSADCYVNSIPSQPNFSGLFTIPPSHSIHSKYRTSNSHMNNPNISSVQENNYKNLENIQNYSNRSLSCEANIHSTPSPESEILHVQLPIAKPNRYRNLSLIEQPRFNINKNPPAPPPRDPRRVIPIQFDNNRPISYCFDKVMQQRNPTNLTRVNRSHQYSNLWHAGYRTASEDHIPTEPKQTLTPRPASVTNETRNQRFINRHTQESTDKFQYLTEKKPRSRKPIFIQSNDKINTTKFNESSKKMVENRWKRDSDEKSIHSSTSPQIFTSQTHLQSKIFLPSVVKADMDTQSLNSVNYQKTESNRFKPISPTLKESKGEITGSNDSIAKELENSESRKSTNLEDALDELEAIYKSLHLGDEDLLERAEQREMSIATKKLLDSKCESYPVYGINRGAFSDSSFTYEPFDSLDSPKKKKYLKKSQTLDRKNDDMAYRKLNKDRANTINNPQTVIANVSYLLASPVHGPQDNIEDNQEEEEVIHDEPDITLDDVVYRTIKHANNSLKVLEPQPPFGIPIGPVTPAPNSDYLHAVPENSPPRYSFKSKKIPDVVKDDLAFRNLRKDHNKEPALKSLVPEDLENNNSMRKKRAVRSLSANISNFIQKDRRGRVEDDGCENEFKKTSLTDIADAMEIARQILKDKENRINTTKRAFLSDSETKYRKGVVGSASSTETITESRLNFLNDMRNDSKDNMSPVRNQLIGDDYLLGKPPRGSTPDKRNTPKERTPSLGENDKNSSFEDLLTALAVEARETSDRITKELKDLDVDLNKNKEVKESKDDELNKKLLDIDAVSEHAKLCEKLLECVVESTELIASTKTESTPIEQVEQIETLIPQSVANVVTTRVEEDTVNPLDVEVHSVSDHDYENLGSDAEFDKAIPLIDEGSDLEVTCKSPFEEHKAEIIATFKELVISDTGSTDDEKLEEGMLEENGGEACVLAVAALPVNTEPVCAYLSESKITITSDNSKTYTSNCDIFINDESQPSSGFHSNSSCTDSVAGESNYLNTNDLIDPVDQIPSLLLESLKSPKLVTSVMKQTNKRFTEEKQTISDISNPSSLAKYTPSTSSTSSSSHNSGQNLGKTRSWYGDPLVLAFACSYGVACSYQLASLDVITILGLLILLLSIAAALIRE